MEDRNNPNWPGKSPGQSDPGFEADYSGLYKAMKELGGFMYRTMGWNTKRETQMIAEMVLEGYQRQGHFVTVWDVERAEAAGYFDWEWYSECVKAFTEGFNEAMEAEGRDRDANRN